MKKIYILGFGCGGKGEVTLRTLDILNTCDKVYVRTTRHPAAEILGEFNIAYTSFDGAYDAADNFEALYETIARAVTQSTGERIAYIVPGSAVFAEKSVQLIRKYAPCPVEIIPAVSFMDGLFAATGMDAADSFKLIDALEIGRQHPDTAPTNVICQVYDNDVASDLKLALMAYYGDEQEVLIINGAATTKERI
jgi:tetrapyrrole methylase family protein/MazG family protein